MTSEVIHWCRGCDVPLLGKVCEGCGSEGRYFAKDLKPVFERERKMLEKFLSIELPEVLFRSIRGNNRIMFGGKRLFLFEMDFKRLKLSPIEPRDKIKERLKGSSSECWKEFLKRMEKCNSEILREKERASIEFIKEASEQHPEKCKVVSFGGGKDSAVVSLLVKKALRDAPLFFADTTLEYPETYEFVERFAKRYKFKLVKDEDKNFYRSKQDFFELCEKLGPPSIRYRWCCYVFKAHPVSKFYENLKEKVLAFSGIRRLESLSRKEYPAIKGTDKIARQILAHPIIDWKEADVWFYLLRKNVINNPLYEIGHTRVGCWPCPNTGPTMCFFRKLTHPHLWKKLEEVLRSYAKKMGEPDGWVDKGWWRLRKPGRNKKVIEPAEVKKEGSHYQLLYSIPLSVHALEHLKPLGRLTVWKNDGSYEYSVSSKNFSISGTIKGKKAGLVLRCKRQGYLESKELFERLIARAINCIGCGGCTGSCPNGAMNVSNRHLVIDSTRCNRCGKCATSNCMALKFASDRIYIKANLFKMAPCVEGLQMNHLIIPDASIGREFADIIRMKGVDFEIHEDGKVLCVSNEMSKNEIEKLFWAFINQ